MMGAMKIPETILIRAGRSVRGGGTDDRFTNATELPRGEIVIGSSFEMSMYPVTEEEWSAFRRGVEGEKETRLPITRVTWFEAVEYADWLSEETGANWRLPTETEWEYACRAGTETPFFTGHDISTDQANYLYTEEGSRIGPGQVRPVGSYPPNAFGLYEMHGNVSEWTLDSWRPSYESKVEVDETRRVVRGGGWDYLPRLLRSSWRDALPPVTRRDDLGF
ncbi:MAG: formylglycine-generating enzyme family protein, partial [Verrucomicrobiota bacterium]